MRKVSIVILCLKSSIHHYFSCWSLSLSHFYFMHGHANEEQIYTMLGKILELYINLMYILNSMIISVGLNNNKELVDLIKKEIIIYKSWYPKVMILCVWKQHLPPRKSCPTSWSVLIGVIMCSEFCSRRSSSGPCF